MSQATMNKSLVKFINDNTPKLNEKLARGLVVDHMRQSEAYVDELIRTIIGELATTANLHYIGMTRLTPIEEFIELSKGRNNSGRQFNMARTDTYMVKLKFMWNNIEFEKPIRLPFVSPGGMIHIFGTNYSISPVLADRIISISPPKIFVRLLSVKFNFDKFDYAFYANGLKQTYPVAKGVIWRTKTQRGKRFAKETPLVYYLLCNHGMSEMFSTYLGVNVAYGIYGEDITEQRYPESDWVICQSLGIKPKKLNIPNYQPTPIAFAIPKNKCTNTMKSVIAGIYFILDQFSDMISHHEFDDPVLWRVCLGMVFFGPSSNRAKLNLDVEDHLSSVDHYLDNIMRIKFRKIGMKIDNMYQLFFEVIDKFDTWLNEYANQENNLYGKEFSVLYFVYIELIKQFVLFYYLIKKKNKNGSITENEVKDAIQKNLRTDQITSINRKHGEVNVVNYCGDNMCFGVTHTLVPQDKTTKERRGDNINLDNPEYRVHISDAEIRTAKAPAKSAPDGSTRVNLCVQIDESGGIVRNESFKDELDRTQEMIARQ